MGSIAPVLRYTAWVSAEEDKGQGGRKHARNLVNAPETEVELRQRLNALQNTTTLASAEAELVLKVLRGHFLFNRMGPEQLMLVVRAVEKLETTPGVDVVTQGEEAAEHFYIVNTGNYQVQVTKADSAEPVTVAQLTSGASFGDMALLAPTVRTATVKCQEAGHVFRLARAAYLLTVSGALDAAASDGSTAAIKSPVEERTPWLFEPLTDLQQTKNLLKTVQEVALDPGEAAFGVNSPIGPVIGVLLDGELSFRGDPSKSSRDDGLWRAAAFGDICADTTLAPGDAFAIGTPVRLSPRRGPRRGRGGGGGD